MLLIGFLAAAGLLWVSVFGYLLVLVALALRRGRPRPTPPNDELPNIAVVVPVRNEAPLIAAKLADLLGADYPADRVTTVVVDGGSTDATAALVEAARANRAGLELVRVAGARGKAEQLNAALRRVRQEVVVVTDVDTALDPACIRALVGTLMADRSAGVVGARVRPATHLLEERIHWWLLNSLWWLEGEALGAGTVSGVCYAVRRSAIAELPADCAAEDIRVALAANARGYRVRLCRHALATELRVPQTLREFLRFRRRRGAAYVRELLREPPAGAPRRWHVMRKLRLYYFLVMPTLAAVAATAGLMLCATPQWQWTGAGAAAFAVPALGALFASTTLGATRRRWWRLSLAASRLAGLTWLSLLGMPRAVRLHIAPGE